MRVPLSWLRDFAPFDRDAASIAATLDDLGLVVEGVAEDGTVEAVRVAGARAFAFGVQFHPEWHVKTDAASFAIFRAFGEACAAYAQGLRRAA